jgi:hypothetical protein
MCGRDGQGLIDGPVSVIAAAAATRLGPLIQDSISSVGTGAGRPVIRSAIGADQPSPVGARRSTRDRIDDPVPDQDRRVRPTLRSPAAPLAPVTADGRTVRRQTASLDDASAAPARWRGGPFITGPRLLPGAATWTGQFHGWGTYRDRPPGAPSASNRVVWVWRGSCSRITGNRSSPSALRA